MGITRALSKRKIAKLRQAPRHEFCVMCGKPDPVLAHRNMPGDFGTGLKGPDWWGAHLCHECHTYGDGKGRKDYQFWELAVYRTMKRLIEMELIVVNPRQVAGRN